jgi:hypothetical protein
VQHIFEQNWGSCSIGFHGELGRSGTKPLAQRPCTTNRQGGISPPSGGVFARSLRTTITAYGSGRAPKFCGRLPFCPQLQGLPTQTFTNFLPVCRCCKSKGRPRPLNATCITGVAFIPSTKATTTEDPAVWPHNILCTMCTDTDP